MLDGPLYAIGGNDGWSFLNTVERWDSQVRSWNYVAPMNAPRSTHGVAVLGEENIRKKFILDPNAVGISTLT